MPNIQLPLCKFTLLFVCCIKPHILCKLENLNRLPKSRVLHRYSNNLSLVSFDDNRKNLLKVSSKHNTQTSEWTIRATNILECTINSFMNVTTLHWSLIPYNQISGLDKSCQQRVFLDPTQQRLVNINWYFEAGVCSSATNKKQCS